MSDRFKHYRVLVTPTSYGKNEPALKTQLEAEVGEVVYNTTGRPLSADELLTLIPEVDGYIAGLDTINRQVIEAADRLKVIARYGVGVDVFDCVFDRRDLGLALIYRAWLIVICINPCRKIFNNVLVIPPKGFFIELCVHNPSVVLINELYSPFSTYSVCVSKEIFRTKSSWAKAFKALSKLSLGEYNSLRISFVERGWRNTNS